MAKVVYVDWRDRQFAPEIVGAYITPESANRAKEKKELDLKKEGYDTDEEVHVCIAEVPLR